MQRPFSLLSLALQAQLFSVAMAKSNCFCTLGLTSECSARCLFRAVATAELTLQQSLQLIFDKLLAERRKMVGKEDAVKVIYLVLQHAGEVTIKPFVVRFKFFVNILHANARVPRYLLVYARQGKAAFL